MSCFESLSPQPGLVRHASEADCMQSCKEGACCTGTTCSVKPQCQCQGAGQVFKGVGTTCTPTTCLPCGCDSPKLQTLTITTGTPQNRGADASVFSKIVEALGNKTITLSFFRSQFAEFEHTNDEPLLYLRSSGDANFSGQQTELDSMQNGELIWRSLATCPHQGMAISDVWAKVSVSGTQYIIKWGTRNFFFNSCSGGSQATSSLGSSFISSTGGSNATYFSLSATVTLA